MDKTLRKNTVHLLEISASNNQALSEACDMIGLSFDDANETYKLARHAFDAVCDNAAVSDCKVAPIDTYAAICLEAAGLLRDGWSPGDPVERL